MLLDDSPSFLHCPCPHKNAGVTDICQKTSAFYLGSRDLLGPSSQLTGFLVSFCFSPDKKATCSSCLFVYSAGLICVTKPRQKDTVVASEEEQEQTGKEPPLVFHMTVQCNLTMQKHETYSKNILTK